MEIKSKADFLGIVTGAVVLAKLLIKSLDVTFVLAIISLVSFSVAGIARLYEIKRGDK